MTIENMMDHLSDIAGIRIICSFTSDIYQIADMIAAQGDITVLHVKDYIQNPKPNGYKSYHMVVTVPVYLADGPVQTKVEIQIRSVAMDSGPAWSIRSPISLRAMRRKDCCGN